MATGESGIAGESRCVGDWRPWSVRHLLSPTDGGAHFHAATPSLQPHSNPNPSPATYLRTWGSFPTSRHPAAIRSRIASCPFAFCLGCCIVRPGFFRVQIAANSRQSKHLFLLSHRAWPELRYRYSLPGKTSGCHWFSHSPMVCVPWACCHRCRSSTCRFLLASRVMGGGESWSSDCSDGLSATRATGSKWFCLGHGSN